MSDREYAAICAETEAVHRRDPLFARYLDRRRESARRLLGLPMKEVKE